MIAVHTLAAAALQILDDLARKQGNIKRLYGRVYERFPREVAVKIMEGVREAQGFFKHADLDPPDKAIKFNPETTPFYLIEAAHLAFALTARMPPESKALLGWAPAAYPEVFKLDDTPRLREWSKTLKPDDFESILYGIDRLSRKQD